jgi:flap endonuclease-1
MGIKGLKNIIKKNAQGSISEVNIKMLKGRSVCIDSSILLYKFRYTYQADNFHILGFLNKIIELLTHRITPVFVFDGKPPEAKREILLKRMETRNKLKERIEKLKEELNGYGDEFIDSDSESESSEEINKLKIMNKELQQLEKNSLTVNKKHADEVVELLKSIGIPFLIANGEAEEYCAFLQKNKYIDYILTEDTDSLTFGGDNILFNVPKNKNNFYLCNLNLVCSPPSTLTYSM